MAYRINRYQCYVCNRGIQAVQSVRINGDNNEQKREIANIRKVAINQPILEVTNETHLCANCTITIIRAINDIERDPSCLRLNVITQTDSRSCMICNRIPNTQRLSIAARVDIFIKTNIYVPENTKTCTIHLNEKGLIREYLLEGLRFVNRHYVIRGHELNSILQKLRRVAENNNKYE